MTTRQYKWLSYFSKRHDVTIVAKNVDDSIRRLSIFYLLQFNEILDEDECSWNELMDYGIIYNY